MKSYLVVFCALVGLTAAIRSNRIDGRLDSRSNGRVIDSRLIEVRRDGRRDGRAFYEFDPYIFKAPNCGVCEPIEEQRSYESSDILVPCPLLDRDCVREYLASHSQCSLQTFDDLPVTKTETNVVREFGYFNVTQIDQYVSVSGLRNCSVSALYVNQTSQNTVLSIDCRDLHYEANRRLIWHRPRLEDLVFHYKINEQYRLITITMNLPNPNNLDICVNKAYAYIHYLPSYQVQPRDAQTDQFIREDPTGMMRRHLDVWVRELSVQRASHTFRGFVQSILCDFNCSTRKSCCN